MKPVTTLFMLMGVLRLEDVQRLEGSCIRLRYQAIS